MKSVKIPDTQDLIRLAKKNPGSLASHVILGGGKVAGINLRNAPVQKGAGRLPAVSGKRKSLSELDRDRT